MADATPQITECHFSKNISCDKAFENAVTFWTITGLEVAGGIIAPEVAFFVVLSGAYYYDVTGQDDEILPLLAGYGFGVALAPVLKYAIVKLPTIIKAGQYSMSKMMVMRQMQTMLNRELSDETIEALYKKALNSECIEIITKETTGASRFTKIAKNTDNTYHVITGSIDNTTNSTVIDNVLVVKDKSINLAAQSETELRLIAEEVAKAGNELVGTYDLGLVKRYFQHIQEVTGRPVSQVQIDKLKEALRAKEYKRLSQEATEAHRIEFNKKRLNLISEWEAKTGQTWPCYADDIYEDGEKVATKGHRYDAHHIIENKYGGENEWWNIHPAARPEEHQRLIHGEGSPALELFKD